MVQQHNSDDLIFEEITYINQLFEYLKQLKNVHPIKKKMDILYLIDEITSKRSVNSLEKLQSYFNNTID